MIEGSVQTMTDPDPGGQKHTDPTDPDPQHWSPGCDTVRTMEEDIHIPYMWYGTVERRQ
jgi:hypothetical protein